MEQKQVSDNWEQGDSYERYVGRWSRLVAPKFLAWLPCQAGRTWLDLGCGTGALSASILDHCAPARVIGVEPSDGFRKTARERLGDWVTLLPGSATAIPLEPGTVDNVVSGLMLNFVDQPRDALREMARVTRAGGIIAAYVWDYADKMELMRYFWESVSATDPRAGHLDEGTRFPLCRPEALVALWRETGLGEVETQAMDIDTPFASFEEYWQPFLGGQGSAPSYVATLDASAAARLREDLRGRVPTQPDGSVRLIARAWAVKGRVIS